MPGIASPERAAVAWAKADTALNALIAGRVATRLPADPTFPFLRIRLSGGSTGRGDAPIWDPLVTFDCYDSTPAGADVLYRTVIDQLEAGVHRTDRGTFTATVLGARPIPEPDTGWERYAVDAVLTLKP